MSIYIVFKKGSEAKETIKVSAQDFEKYYPEYIRIDKDPTKQGFENWLKEVHHLEPMHAKTLAMKGYGLGSLVLKSRGAGV